jgi:hypothetical protein
VVWWQQKLFDRDEHLAVVVSPLVRKSARPSARGGQSLRRAPPAYQVRSEDGNEGSLPAMRYAVPQGSVH